jgi:hypothetical protein
LPTLHKCRRGSTGEAGKPGPRQYGKQFRICLAAANRQQRFALQSQSQRSSSLIVKDEQVEPGIGINDHTRRRGKPNALFATGLRRRVVGQQLGRS